MYKRQAFVIASTKKAASEPKNLSTNNSILIFLGLRVLNNAMASSASPFITLLSREVGENIELVGKGIGGDKVSDLLTRYRFDVIKLNPDILPMRIALANRYFESYDYSNALIHFMYVAENTDDIDLKSYSLAQIGWMVYESGDELTSMSYINEAVRLSPGSLLGSTYKGIIYVQNPNTRSEGIKILESLKSNTSLPEDDLKIINEILVIYEN